MILVVAFLLISVFAHDKLLPPLVDLPPGVNLQRIADVTEGHEDLYLASDYPYRAFNAYLWLSVLSATGSTNLEGAHFEWDGVLFGMYDGRDGPLVHITSDRYCVGLVSVKISLATGDEVTLKSWLPTKDGCWMYYTHWEAQPGVDEFGEEWPYTLMDWNSYTGYMQYATDLNASWCDYASLYGGTNSCDSFRGIGDAMTSSCGEVFYKYRTPNITLVQDGDELIQYFAQGRTRRYRPMLDSSLVEQLDVRSNRSRIPDWLEPSLVPCKI
eukprot:Gregarina_sp_Pseudo_9__420@NODE_1274_length_1722_cov_615_563874_g1198_i0_p1_GENE_NODE_1274_length_1722_cov_615_563874_g1198_i0NODE_1274_length_1722_cov_615_563874_g1198_i0_p1_ORF_typecomplete_len270_score2_05_NODE_1274_length_1722_cov_615_563874_g1198_i04791288